jgi:tetratricopeptide (TPR) repeat protein
MRNACLGLLLGLCLMAAIPAWAEDVLVNGCREEDDPHIRLAYCTKLIESGKSVEEAKAWAAIARGDAYLDDEEYEQAIASYNDAIRLKPGDDEAWNDRGIAYQYSGEEDKAIMTTTRPSGSTPRTPLRSTIAVGPIAGKASTTRPFRIWIWQSVSSPTMRVPI